MFAMLNYKQVAKAASDNVSRLFCCPYCLYDRFRKSGVVATVKV